MLSQLKPGSEGSPRKAVSIETPASGVRAKTNAPIQAHLVVAFPNQVIKPCFLQEACCPPSIYTHIYIYILCIYIYIRKTIPLVHITGDFMGSVPLYGACTTCVGQMLHVTSLKGWWLISKKLQSLRPPKYSQRNNQSWVKFAQLPSDPGRRRGIGNTWLL